MKRPKLVVANWKMYLNVHEASLLANRLGKKVQSHRDVEVVLAPNYLCLQPLSREIDHHKFKLAAQDGYYIDEGAYTGAVSFNQLRELVNYAIIGHSERRRYFNESLDEVRDKVAAAVRNGITPILCVGETKEERTQKETKQVLHDQVVTALSNLTAEDAESLVLAYEPVWAIGANEPAKPDTIAAAVDWIRFQVRELYGKTTESSIRVLYGGSDEPEYVSGIMATPGVDGLLVGRASLNYERFSDIITGVHLAVLSEDKTVKA
ncbi:triose-phosphate isomerase [Patescibacteria group bacterium]|nr:triose-phosphate isomerase [Patescibacteria group bacterium]